MGEMVKVFIRMYELNQERLTFFPSTLRRRMYKYWVIVPDANGPN